MKVNFVVNVAHLNYEQRTDLGHDIQACVCAGDCVFVHYGARLTGKRNYFFIDGTASKATIDAIKRVICNRCLRLEK